MNEKLVVAYVCDNKYIPYIKISMDSIKRYNKNVEFAILSTETFDMPGATVYTFNPAGTKFKFNLLDRMGDGVYYKFWLPELPYDKVLFMDCDVVCQRPLDSLWNEPCDFICATESHSYGKTQAQQLNIKKYALTGMMLMNLKELRRVNFTEQCLRKLKTYTPRNHDETIINLLFSDRIQFIDKKYNYCRNRKYDKPIAESDAYLLHYVGANQKRDLLLRDNFSGLEKLKDVLKGKSVAIVGNSVTLLDKHQGSEIDAHDIVIRFNKGFPSELVGNKTDIVFLACSLTKEEFAKYGNAIKVKRSEACKNTCAFQLSKADKFQLVQKLIPEYRHTNLNATASQPSTGFVAINFALACDCKNIDIYGFDFFKTPTYYNKRGFVPLHNGSDEETKILEYESCWLLKIF